MAGNTAPLAAITANTPVGNTIVTANTAKDGTGTVVTALTGGANDTLVKGIVLRPLGTNSTASVARIFLNNGSTNATAGNNVLIGEITLPTSTLSETSQLTPQVWFPDIPNFVLKNGYKLNVTVGTSGTAGWSVHGVGADY
jgi:hypothetical protein